MIVSTDCICTFQFQPLSAAYHELAASYSCNNPSEVRTVATKNEETFRTVSTVYLRKELLQWILCCVINIYLLLNYSVTVFTTIQWCSKNLWLIFENLVFLAMLSCLCGVQNWFVGFVWSLDSFGCYKVKFGSLGWCLDVLVWCLVFFGSLWATRSHCNFNFSALFGINWHSKIIIFITIFSKVIGS